MAKSVGFRCADQEPGTKDSRECIPIVAYYRSLFPKVPEIWMKMCFALMTGTWILSCLSRPMLNLSEDRCWFWLQGRSVLSIFWNFRWNSFQEGVVSHFKQVDVFLWNSLLSTANMHLCFNMFDCLTRNYMLVNYSRWSLSIACLTQPLRIKTPRFSGGAADV